MSNLSQLYEIQKALKEVNYPDYKRVSKEIIQYVHSEKQLKKVLKNIKKDKPWEYICSRAEFYTLDFIVNQNTLIPRIESEKIVSLAIEKLKETDFDTVIDVGTGAGCIIVSLVNSLKIPKIYKKKLKETSFLATDSSSQALKIARKNAKKHGVDKSIKFKKTDLLKGIDLDRKKVLICTNLPYIPTKKYKKLDNSVKKYEPKMALDGGKDGNKYYKRLYKQIIDSGLKTFTLILETDGDIIKDTKKIFKEFSTMIVKDIYDKERFLIVSG